MPAWKTLPNSSDAGIHRFSPARNPTRRKYGTREIGLARNRVRYWEINGTAGKQLADFYTGLFDWQYDNDPGSDYYYLHSGGEDAGINGGVFTGKGKLPHHLTIYVEVEDVDAYYAKALGLGGTRAQDPFDVPNLGRLGFFRDPDGHIIGLIQRPGSAAKP